MARAIAAFAALCLPGLQLFATERPFGLGKNYAARGEIGQELIGAKAPAWNVSDWINSPPLDLNDLRGRVVLVRWWTAPGCSYCAASAAALNKWAAKYAKAGLVVVGIYHHKIREPLTADHVAREARKLGFTFPVAVDHEWRTLQRWWLDPAPRGWTSATFLLDRRGVIRHVHPGGAYFEGEPGFVALENAIEQALAES